MLTVVSAADQSLDTKEADAQRGVREEGEEGDHGKDLCREKSLVVMSLLAMSLLVMSLFLDPFQHHLLR